MWSLPDINKRNKDAADNAAKLRKRAGRKVKLSECDYNCNGGCEGDVRVQLYYDIFSDDPKGELLLCDKHDGYYGSPEEGFFTCSDCHRVMIENITWENYYHVEDGEILCLNCYRERELSNANNWINLTEAGIEGVTEKTLHGAKHLIAVGQKCPAGLRFVTNTEFDNTDGHCISGGGLRELKDKLIDLKAEGHSRAISILDAAYQFAVSIGLYVEDASHKEAPPVKAAVVKTGTKAKTAKAKRARKAKQAELALA